MPKLKNNIILIGPMGSGKTSIGKKLSKMMKFNFIDTDHLIEEKTGVDIPTIFEHEGESGFRKRENKILEDISNIENSVLGTGGGIIILEENRKIIKNMGFIVYLTASIKELVYRTEQDRNRPLIKDGDTKKKIEEILKEREKIYENISNIKISTDNYDTVKLSKIIIKNYEKNNS
ncbi:shikimate kinase [Gammaproteobacteria bacterium]|nr:shikimate kinase [Gammaproteobacteria bacterium]